MKFSYLALFLASTAFASAIATTAEAVEAVEAVEGAEAAEAAVYRGHCDRQSQICTYNVHGNNRRCHCGQPSGGRCTRDRNVCHWNTSAHPDRCDCS